MIAHLSKRSASRRVKAVRASGMAAFLVEDLSAALRLAHFLLRARAAPSAPRRPSVSLSRFLGRFGF
jgi:hypothetical protein